MDNLQKIEQLVSKAGCSYEDAKAALEGCGWDMIDAIISLEEKAKSKRKQQSILLRMKRLRLRSLLRSSQKRDQTAASRSLTHMRKALPRGRAAETRAMETSAAEAMTMPGKLLRRSTDSGSASRAS